MRTIQNFKSNLSTLYLVSTPIGNLNDISFRALQTIESVDFLLCEDTRVTGKLMHHFELSKELISYHEHNKDSRTEEVLKRLTHGESAALVSDAGMPVISDPGFELVRACLEQEIPVVPIPGANAALTALIASGVAPKPFTFFGFLHQKENKRLTELESLKYIDHTLLFYESVHRIEATLRSIHSVLGNRYIVLGRELTKQFEEFTFGTVEEVLNNLPKLKGELVIVVSPPEESAIQKPILVQVEELISLNVKPMDAIKQVAKMNNLKKQDVYKMYEENK